MKNVIIIHGRPSKEVYYSDKFPTSANFAWLPWLKKQLMIRDIKADTPEMPHAYEPDYVVWSKEFERFDITINTTLVGHSAGAGFIIRWLSERPFITVQKIILIAPSINSNTESLSEFYNFALDKKLAERCEVLLIVSDNDDAHIQKSVEKIQEFIKNTRIIVLPGYGHFIPGHMNGSSEFPELLQEVI
jgi:predicted alpha/beta hydrolase family esterase